MRKWAIQRGEEILATISAESMVGGSHPDMWMLLDGHGKWIATFYMATTLKIVPIGNAEAVPSKSLVTAKWPGDL